MRYRTAALHKRKEKKDGRVGVWVCLSSPVFKTSAWVNRNSQFDCSMLALPFQTLVSSPLAIQAVSPARDWQQLLSKALSPQFLSRHYHITTEVSASPALLEKEEFFGLNLRAADPTQSCSLFLLTCVGRPCVTTSSLFSQQFSPIKKYK